MMLVLGVLSLIQVVFLPGHLFVRYWLRLTGGIREVVLTFSISLLVNHLLVCFLTVFNLYNRVSLAVILIMELAGIIYLRLKVPAELLSGGFAEDRQRFKAVWSGISQDSFWVILLNRALLFCASVTIGCFLYRLFNGFGSVFDQWDDLVSWNRWALDWYDGRFPTFTWHYPQLLPTAWSITYLSIGSSSIQFFAKGMMGFFPLLILLAQFDLWLRTKYAGFLAGIPITAFMLIFANGVKVVGSGYADVPVAFMAFVPIYLLLTTAPETDRLERVLFVGSLTTAGAALTKQAGLMVLFIYPLLTWCRFRVELKLIKIPASRLLIHLILALALTLPWYMATEYRIKKGVEQSEIKLVTEDIQNNRGAFERIAIIKGKVAGLVKGSPRLDQVASLLGASVLDGVTVVSVLLLSLVLLSFASIFLNSFWRLPAVGVMLPFSVVWLLFYSYDFRNLTLALPYMGAGAGLSILCLVEQLVRRLPVLRITPVMVWAMSLVILAGSANFVDREYLQSRQIRLQREVGNPEVSRLIYSLLERDGRSVVLTNYQPVQFLPGLEKQYRLDAFDSGERFAGEIVSGHCDYLLIFRTETVPTASVQSTLSELLATRRITEIRSPRNGYELYRILR